MALGHYQLLNTALRVRLERRTDAAVADDYFVLGLIAHDAGGQLRKQCDTSIIHSQSKLCWLFDPRAGKRRRGGLAGDPSAAFLLQCRCAFEQGGKSAQQCRPSVNVATNSVPKI